MTAKKIKNTYPPNIFSMLSLEEQLECISSGIKELEKCLDDLAKDPNISRNAIFQCVQIHEIIIKRRFALAKEEILNSMMEDDK